MSQCKTSAYTANQLFWGKPLHTIENGYGGEFKPKEIATVLGLPESEGITGNENLYEIACRKLLLDPNVFITSGSDPIVFSQFLDTIRNRSLSDRQAICEKFSNDAVLRKLMGDIPDFVVGNLASVGSSLASPTKLTAAKKLKFMKTLLPMLTLTDELSITVMACIGPMCIANQIDLPWNSIKVYEAFKRSKYPISTISNWMYAQGFSYLDNEMFKEGNAFVAMDLNADYYVLSHSDMAYIHLPHHAFVPAYEQGLFHHAIPVDSYNSFGWEEVNFNA